MNSNVNRLLPAGVKRAYIPPRVMSQGLPSGLVQPSAVKAAVALNSDVQQNFGNPVPPEEPEFLTHKFPVEEPTLEERFPVATPLLKRTKAICVSPQKNSSRESIDQTKILNSVSNAHVALRSDLFNRLDKFEQTCLAGFGDNFSSIHVFFTSFQKSLSQDIDAIRVATEKLFVAVSTIDKQNKEIFECLDGVTGFLAQVYPESGSQPDDHEEEASQADESQGEEDEMIAEPQDYKSKLRRRS